MSYRPVTYKKFSGSYEMLKQLLPSELLKTGFYKSVLQGETGWSVQMALDAQNKTVYVYDESSKQWYTASWIKRKDIGGKWYTRCKFIPCRKPYLDFISTAVVGSRQPTEDMIHELEDLFQRSLFLEG